MKWLNTKRVKHEKKENIKVKQNIDFLKKFPHLNDWLNLNGFSLIVVEEIEILEQVYTVWSDRSSELINGNNTDAKCWLVINYCKRCGVVEVYERKAIFSNNIESEISKKMLENAIIL